MAVAKIIEELGQTPLVSGTGDRIDATWCSKCGAEKSEESRSIHTRANCKGA